MRASALIFIVALVVVLTGLLLIRRYSPAARFGETAETVDRMKTTDALREGDLIFQTSMSDQSKAVQRATGSFFSHCGILFSSKNEWYVFEATEPVKSTPLVEWIARGDKKQFAIRRLKNADVVLTAATVSRMKEVAAGFARKHYDLRFEWSDDRMYCSELIWKIYERAAGVRIGQLQQLREFNLDDALVAAKLKKRYPDKIPLSEPVISPISIYKSDKLFTVRSNYP